MVNRASPYFLTRISTQYTEKQIAEIIKKLQDTIIANKRPPSWGKTPTRKIGDNTVKNVETNPILFKTFMTSRGFLV